MKFYTTSKLSENISETPEGFLVCIGVPIARTGEMLYNEGETPLEADEDGKVIITRDAAEVFRLETMASFEGKAVTITHPTDFVSPENWSKLAKGILQNVRRGKGDQKNDLIADLLITDGEAIQLVKMGLREVSCGYEADYTQTGKGRGVQKDIIGNHLALVDEGRAGSSYAINDHKGKESEMKLGDRIKGIFAKAADEAIAEAEKETKAAAPSKTKDEEPAPAVTGMSYDDFKKCMDDFGAKMQSFMGKGGKDASTEPTENTPAKVVAKDDEVATGLEDRLKKLEASVAAILKKLSATSDDDDEVVDDDGDGDEDDVTDSDDDEGATETGDTASRVEILAPGMDAAAKNVKAKALVAAYATKDGKAEIHKFTQGKAPDFKDEKLVDLLFIGVSEGLKATRSQDFARTKTGDFSSNLGQPKGAMTPEKMNEVNDKHFGNRTSH